MRRRDSSLGSFRPLVARGRMLLNILKIINLGTHGLISAIYKEKGCDLNSQASLIQRC